MDTWLTKHSALAPDPRVVPPGRRSAAALDDDRDREELRNRYYGLLQEVRVLLPGVQLLMAFLLTVPFADGFDSLDTTGRVSFGLAMFSATGATVSFVTPTAFHRVADHGDRSVRLVWSIRAVRLGLSLLAVALLSALFCVTWFVYGAVIACLAVMSTAVMIVVLWLLVPLTTRRPEDDSSTRSVQG